MFTPNASMTSAEPHLEVRLRLPCFAMRTPAGFTRDMQFAMEVLKGHDAMRWWADEFDRPGEHGRVIKMSA